MRFLQSLLFLSLLIFTGCALSSPEATTPNVSLKNSYFKLIYIGSQEAKAFDNQSEPHLILGNEGELYGSDGCNRIIGAYKVNGDEIEFSHIGTTMMACQNGMKQANMFIKQLNEVKSYSISGEKLKFLNENGEILLTFRAVLL